MLETPGALATLAQRMEALIAKMHAGSVNSAAGLTGVPLSTMQRIVSGASTNPRANVLQRIANYYGAPLEWLLTGAGPVPDVLNSNAITEAAWQWTNLVRSLDLPPMITEELRHLPDTRHDFYRFVLMAPMWATHIGRAEAVQAFMTAGDYREWYDTFAGLLQLLGKDEVRRVCARHPQLIRGRFSLPLRKDERELLAAEQLAVLGAEDAEIAKEYYEHAILMQMMSRVPADVHAAQVQYEESILPTRRTHTKSSPVKKKAKRKK